MTTAREKVAGQVRGFDHRSVGVEELQALYRDMHAHCPIGRSGRWGGFFLVTRHEDVRSAAADHQAFSSREGFLLPPSPFPFAAIDYDPPEHGYWRDLFVEALSAARVQAAEHEFQAIAEELLAPIAVLGAGDLVTPFVIPFPVRAIFALLGVTDPDRAAEGRRVTEPVLHAISDEPAFLAAMGPYAAFCLEEIDARRVTPRADFLTRLATQPAGGRLIADETIVHLMMGFMLAGMTTTANAVASLLCRVTADPVLRARVGDDPAARRAAVEETLRLDTPLQLHCRVATRDVDLNETTIPAGSKVMLSYGAANRDPSVFADGERFDLDRGVNRHLAFGDGIHTCAGAALARLLMRVALDAVLDRLPDAEADGDPERAIVTGNALTVLSLPVRWRVPQPHARSSHTGWTLRP